MKEKSFASFLPAKNRVAAPWKNGGGVTREIAIHPPSAQLARSDFLWRLSAAEVKAAGPFSLFPGYARLLAVTAGRELVLRSPTELVAVPRGQVAQLRGEDEFTAELPHGSVEDLGLLYRPDLFQAAMKLFDFGPRARSFELPPATNFFVAMEGEFAVEVFPGEEKFALSPGDALRVDPLSAEPRIVLFQPTAKQGKLVAVEIISTSR